MNTFSKTFAACAIAALATFAAQAHEFKIADIKIGHPYARATTQGQTNGGAYLSLDNAGADDKLLSVDAATVAGRTEIHQMAMEGDVTKMRQVDGIDVAKGKPVTFKPGGYHVMLMHLKRALVPGDRLELVLAFERAGLVTVAAEVRGG